MRARLTAVRSGVPLSLLVATLACSPTAQGSAGADAEPAAAAARCEFPDSYSFAVSGGMVPVRDSYVLEPPDRFTMTRTSMFASRTSGECSGELPACEAPNSGGLLSVTDVMNLLGDPAVVEAWPDAGEVLFGADLRPVDGSVLAVTGGRGGTLLIGHDCRGASGCTPVPPEIDSLGNLLATLAEQIAAAPECAGLQE